MTREIGTGTAWARRQFAKLLATGSIPARASRKRRLISIFDFTGGPRETRKMLRAAAYNKSYQPPFCLDLLARHLVMRLQTERDEWRSKAIAASKELTKLKRQHGAKLDK